MKEIHELNLPENLHYTKDHEWARKQGDLIVVGINDYAQDQLGDIVFVELPEPGEKFSEGDEFGTVESVKAVSELFLPIAGEVADINEDLADTPELVNSNPYDEGWMIKFKPDNPADFDKLLDRDAYLTMLKG
ncbi:MAG: glycine cleavage system protein GcvH [Desulfobacteraceae bacterium]|nr:glycine cleavage system protein GcvH [Desulfobacteraceae bacterium]